MAQQKLDTILAFKALSLARGLSGPDKAVGAALLDHYNRKTGRCDPSLQCISELVGVSERTVIRSVKRLVQQSLFVKIRHGGLGYRNQYEPNWKRYREIESQWLARRLARSARLRGEHLSPSRRQICHLKDDRPVNQTCFNNSLKETCVEPRANRLRVITACSAKMVSHAEIMRKRPVRSAEAAIQSAQRNWERALRDLCAGEPEKLALVIDGISAGDVAVANEAEVRRPGSGLRTLLDRLVANGLADVAAVFGKTLQTGADRCSNIREEKRP